jgi:PhoH-like ATPase
VLIKAFENPNQSAIGIFDGKNIVPLVNEKYVPFGIVPKNVGQRYIMDALVRPASEAPLVIVKGPAGTGKTLVALAVGLEEVIENGNYEKVLYLRGNVKLDEDIGYLPGTEKEKLDWALRPVRDNLKVIFRPEKETYSSKKKSKRTNAYGSDYDKDFLTDDMMLKDKIDELFEREYIDIEAVAHMRGRSIDSTFVIIDEAQNLTPKQIRTLLSRCSTDTKIILLGDPNQIDHPFLDFRTNGLCYAADRMAGSETTYQLSMLEEECERSELSLEISKRMSD